MSLLKLSIVALTQSLPSIEFAESRGDRNVVNAMEANQKAMAAYAAQKARPLRKFRNITIE